MNSSVVEKIKKLLSLAQSDNPNERDAALQKAMALATDHQIDLAMIDLSGVGVLKDEPMIKLDVTFGAGRRRPVEHRFVSTILRRFFNVEIVWGWCGEWHFIGTQSDTEFAKWLCGFLLEEADRRWKYYRNTELATLPGIEARAFRNTFIYGLFAGLERKLDEAKVAAENARFSPTAAGAASDTLPEANDLRQRYALVVQDTAAKREAAKNSFFPSLRKGYSRGVRVRSHSAFSAGVASGRTISCSRPIAA